MKAITVRQPWAWAIAWGGKTIENRTQQFTYRGPLAIHAGAGWSEHGQSDPRVLEALDRVSCERGAGRVHVGDLAQHAGCIVAVAELVDVHPDAGCCRPWGESTYVEASGRRRTVVRHLVLEEVTALEDPIPVRGALGLWTPPADLLELLAALAA